jgi:hypothetical protein
LDEVEGGVLVYEMDEGEVSWGLVWALNAMQVSLGMASWELAYVEQVCEVLASCVAQASSREVSSWVQVSLAPPFSWELVSSLEVFLVEVFLVEASCPQAPPP